MLLNLLATFVWSGLGVGFFGVLVKMGVTTQDGALNMGALLALMFMGICACGGLAAFHRAKNAA